MNFTSPLRAMDRGGWMALGAICLFATVVGTLLGRPASASPHLSTLLAMMMVVCGGRALLRSMRAGGRRQRARGYLARQLQSHGGGSYGAVALATWLFLETQSLRTEWARADGMMGFLEGQSWQWIIGFSADSISHAIHASLWPLYLMREYGMMAAGAAFAMVWVTDRVLRQWMPRVVEADEAPLLPGAPLATEPFAEPAREPVAR